MQIKFENSNSNEHILEPEQIRPNVFAGKHKAVSGEDIYLHMDLITPENEPYWRQYVKEAGLMTRPARSMLTYLTAFIEKKGETYYFSKPYDAELQTQVGFSEEEFNKFINYCGKQGFYRENERKRKLLEINVAGSGHILLNSDGSQYIIYATKTPNFSIQSTRLIHGEEWRYTLKEHLEQYKDLLMCVGSNFSFDKDSYHNRGIFRNPINVIENTHKGISMILHSFSGAVAKKFFEEKTIMNVKPVSSMQRIICT